MAKTGDKLQDDLLKAQQEQARAQAELVDLRSFLQDLEFRLEDERGRASHALGSVEIGSLVATAERQAAAQITVLSLQQSIEEVRRRIEGQESQIATRAAEIQDIERALAVRVFREQTMAMLPKLDVLRSELEQLRLSWPNSITPPNYTNWIRGRCMDVHKAIDAFSQTAPREDL